MKIIASLFVFSLSLLYSNKTNTSFPVSKDAHYHLEKNNDYVESILVTIKSEYCDFDSDYGNTLFKKIDKNKIRNLTEIYNENVKPLIAENYHQIYEIRLSGKERYNFKAVKEDLLSNCEVFSVEPNDSFEIQTEPNDYYYANDNMWGLNGLNGINAPDAWDYSVGSSSIRVGIIDTGLSTHPDLNSNTVSGWDFYNGNATTSDDTKGHGTWVAGVIGGQGNNSIGITGVNWNVSLVPLQCSNINNKFETSTVISAITYATNQWGTDNQIDILNYSVAGFGYNTQIRNAVQNYPGLFVWAVGNGGTDVDIGISAYGSFNISNLISVGALQSNGDRWTDPDYASNYSQSNTNVNIYAPGHGIYTTFLGNTYGQKRGTSIAAPHVTGVAALLLSYHHHLTASQLKSIIINYSTTGQISIPNEDGTGTTIQNVKKLNAELAMEQAATLHSYTDHYTSISNSFHNAYCECGGYTSQPHAIIQGSEFWMHGHEYANCCVCNQLIDLTNGYGFIIVLSDDTLVTDNGSYILPNGIYYLVEEDLEDYINGNLVFHPYGEIGA